MRMRKKKNLVPRMEACSALWIREPAALRGAWRSLKPDAARVRLELGCGKGRFTAETAAAHPDDLYIAVERVPDAMVTAMERCRTRGLENVFFIDGDAAKLPELFAPGETDLIYINFCDPWPSLRHAKRRLTHPGFLLGYRQVLRDGGEIRFKTDNRDLFEWSLFQFPKAGFILSQVTRDLHAGGVRGVMTDYEEKFHRLGTPICRCVAEKGPLSAEEEAALRRAEVRAPRERKSNKEEVLPLKFTKMHGLGNDYIYVDCTKTPIEDMSGLSVRLSDRHFGVGGDGLICICPSDKADFRMRMFNADGSEGAMCGNGIRCVGKFVYDKGLTDKTELTIETGAGIRALRLTVTEGRVSEVTVDMGAPVVEAPVTLSVLGEGYTGVPVSVGNPHFVLEVPDPAALDLPAIGPGFENHPRFPDRTNTEFVRVLAPDEIQMRVWERGSGETMACGTGASATLAAMVSQGRCAREATVHLLGGDLRLKWDEASGHIFMTGPAVTVFEGELV